MEEPNNLDLQPNKPIYIYRYVGSNRVDAVTLLQSQIHFINALKLIHAKQNPVSELNPSYLPSQVGSHMLLLSFDWQSISALFNALEYKELFEGVKTTIETFSELVKLLRSLRGKRPENEVQKEGNSIQINFGSNNQFNIQGSTLNFAKNNPKVIEEIIQSFTPLVTDREVEGIQLIDPAGEQLHLDVQQSHFESIAQPNPYSSEEGYERVVYKAHIFVKTTDFYPKPKKAWKWEFIFNQRPIKAVISDKLFESQINHGLRYGQGDRLIVDLKLYYKKDTTLNTYIIWKYEINKVHDSIFRSDEEQKELI